MNSSRINILIIGLGNIGQQVLKELCVLKLHNKININKLYIYNRNINKINLICEDILSSILLITKREKININNYFAVEKMLTCTDLKKNLSLNIIILAFGAKLNQYINFDKVLDTSQRHNLLTEHKSILDTIFTNLNLNLQSLPLIINIVNPIEEICKSIVIDYNYDKHKVIGCSAELDSIRGYKYLSRDRINTCDLENLFYTGKHNEEGKYIFINNKISPFQIKSTDKWPIKAKKEGGQFLYYNKKPPIFGPGESILNIIVAMLDKSTETPMSCSIWNDDDNEFHSKAVLIRDMSFKKID